MNYELWKTSSSAMIPDSKFLVLFFIVIMHLLQKGGKLIAQFEYITVYAEKMQGTAQARVILVFVFYLDFVFLFPAAHYMQMQMVNLLTSLAAYIEDEFIPLKPVAPSNFFANKDKFSRDLFVSRLQMRD